MAVSAAKLREGTPLLVKGKVAFSHITRQRTGKALADHVQQAYERGQIYPTKVPHTAIALYDAEIVLDPQGDGKPNQEEEFLQEKNIYVSKSGKHEGKTGYSIEDVSSMLPAVMVKQPSGNHGHLKDLKGELDEGLEVLLELRVYKPKEHPNRGIGLQKIIVLEDEIRYYSNNASSAELSALGITIEGPIDQVSVNEAGNDPVPANSVVSDQGHVLPGPGPAAAAADQPAAEEPEVTVDASTQAAVNQASAPAQGQDESDSQPTEEELQAEIERLRARKAAAQSTDQSAFTEESSEANPWTQS